MVQQYQATPPAFGFTRSEMGGLPTTLNHINPAYYDQIAEFVRGNDARLASANGLVLYDTLRLDPATTLSTAGFNFFQAGIGKQGALYNAGTGYTKSIIDVHPWVQDGRFDEGYEALIWSIQVRLQLPGASDLTVQTSGNALNLTLSPGAIVDEPATAIQGAAIKTGNIMRALQESLTFTFYVNETRFERGPMWRFPCVYQSANQIGLAGVVANPLNDAIVGNGMGWAYTMPFMRHLPQNTRFGVEMQVGNGFSFAITNGVPQMRIVVILEGVGISPLSG